MAHAHPRAAGLRWLWPRAMAAVLAVVLAATGCGGGVGSGGTGTGSFAQGAIAGFGSVIVNGVRFDDSAASVIDDDDAARSSSDLKLGMMVEIDAGPIATGTSGKAATASRIRYGSEVLGPVTRVDTTTNRFTLLGQTVQVGVDTVFDERIGGGLSGLAAGNIVEVFGQYDPAAGLYRATRVESRSGVTAWRLRGVVDALDNSARTLRIGSATIAWGSATSIPADLGVGRVVRIQLSVSTDSAGRYVALTFGTALRTPPDRPDATLEGVVTSFSSTRSFGVNGQTVDASTASFPDGTSALKLGARVTVSGRVEAGTIIATTVSIDSDEKLQERGFEFKGPVQAVSTSARTVTVRGTVISTARSDLRVDGGTLADLVVGRSVEIKATLVDSRTGFEATRITFP